MVAMAKMEDTIYLDGISRGKKMKYLFFTGIILAFFLLNACVPVKLIDNSNDQVRDIVMKEGMIVTIENPDCFSLTVRAGKGLERFYTWNNGTRSVVLLPRKDKWYGSYGAYFPGTDHHWKRHDGVTRLLAEEAVLDFDNYEQILCAISEKQNDCREKYYEYVNGQFDFKNSMTSALYSDACGGYTSDGVFVSVNKKDGPGSGGTLSVTIYQIMLNGQPVNNLPDSSNERIKVNNNYK